MINIPFPGTKRYSYKRVREIFIEGGYDSVYEPFGGSCVLSVNLFHEGLADADKVFINDYDRFFDRYPEVLDKKDWIVKKMNERGIFRSSGCAARQYRYTNAEETERVPVETQLLPLEDKLYLQSLMVEVGEEWWRPLSFGSCFNHACVPNHSPIKISDFRYFKSRVSTEKARHYLSVVQKMNRESKDWREFLEGHRAEMDRGTLLIVDPPYFGTNSNAYEGSFTEQDTIELIMYLKELNVDFIFFNDDIEWMDWALNEFGFTDYELCETGNRNSSMTRKRRDGMAYVVRGLEPAREGPKFIDI